MLNLIRPGRVRPETVPAVPERPVDIEGLVVSLDGRTVLDGLNLIIGQGERVLVSGPSGSGKTTLANVVRGIQPFKTGRVIINGHERAPQQVVLGESGVGYVPQKPALPTNFPFQAVAGMQAGLTGHSVNKAELQGLMEGFGLPQELLFRPDSTGLSGGETARLAVIAALLARTRLLVLDEPAGALDHTSRERFATQLGDVCRHAGMTALAISHDPLPGFSTREVVMTEGVLCPVPDNNELGGVYP